MDSVRETERDSETEQDSDRQRVKGRERRRDRVNEREQMRKNIISNIICSSVGDRPTKYKPRHSHSTQFLFVCFLFKLQTNKNAGPCRTVLWVLRSSSCRAKRIKTLSNAINLTIITPLRRGKDWRCRG